MPDDAAALAERLLDAQVEWALTQLSGDRLVELLARDVEDVLAIAGTIRVSDALDADAVKTALRRAADVVVGSAAVGELLPLFADAVHGLPAADDHDLGDLVDRDAVDALVAKVVTMHRLQDRAMDRLAESPLVATIATRYVTGIVTDFVQQNRERAEKVPGMSSLLSIGFGAASKVRGTADQLLGDAQARSAQYAIRRSNSAVRDVLHNAPVQDAALEVWDLQAAEPIGALREYVTAAELRELLTLIYDLVRSAGSHAYVGDALDACVDAFVGRYGDTDVRTLLADLGLTADVLTEDVRRLVPPVLDAARADGRLATLVRERLEPFFTDPATLAILGGAPPPRRPRPAATKG